MAAQPLGLRARCAMGGLAVGALPIMVLMAYNALCFGSPFTLSYARIAAPEFAQVHAEGVLGIALPRLDRLVYLTVHPVRGLFLQSPILLAGLIGLVPMAMNRRWRLEAAVIALSLLAMVALNAGFPVWWGGYSFAPQHLMIPVVMLLCVPIAFVPARWHTVVAVLLAISIVQMAIPTISTPMPSDAWVTNTMSALVDGHWLPWQGSSPIWTDGLQALRSGTFRPTVGTWIGLSPVVSLGIAATAIALALGIAARGERPRPHRSL